MANKVQWYNILKKTPTGIFKLNTFMIHIFIQHKQQ